ncbi:hypothetical protein DPSP01_012244 [Paraphaeosphaeria sporulosa]
MGWGPWSLLLDGKSISSKRIATDGARHVRSGNWQNFDNTVARAGTDLKVDTTVTGIELLMTEEKHMRYKSSPSDLGSDATLSAQFDTVIFTTPYNQSSIAFTPRLHVQPKRIDYVIQHITLLASPHRPCPNFFNLSDPTNVPDSILTTTPAGYDLTSGAPKRWTLTPSFSPSQHLEN